MVTTDLNTQDVFNLIAGIPDPEIPVITIQDLGILRGVKLVDDTYVVTITPTYTACPAMGMIEDQIKEILSSHGIQKVKVELTYTPAWTTDWLSQEAKTKLKNMALRLLIIHLAPNYLVLQRWLFVLNAILSILL